MGNINQNYDQRTLTELTSNSSSLKPTEMKFQRLAGHLHDQLLDENGQPMDLSDHVIEYIRPEPTKNYLHYVTAASSR